jgi:hypothetical protein
VVSGEIPEHGVQVRHESPGGATFLAMPDRTPSVDHWRRSCRGKAKHETFEASLDVLLLMVERHQDPDLVHRLQSYRCGYCGQIHLGRRLRSLAEDSRRRWAKAAEKQRRRALWDPAAPPPRTPFELWLERARHQADFQRSRPGVRAGVPSRHA